MTFKRRLWNTITLTILFFLVVLYSILLLALFVEHIEHFPLLLPLIIVLMPFFCFTFQTAFHYLFKKDYPVQEKPIKNRKLRTFIWIFQVFPFVFLVLKLRTIFLFSMLFIPAFWMWIIVEFKNNYGKKTMIYSFAFILITLIYSYISLESCPSDSPLRNHFPCGHLGGCYSCDEKSSVLLSNPDDCTNICPNRYSDGYRCHFVIESCPEDLPLKRVGEGLFEREGEGLLGKVEDSYEKKEPVCTSCDETKALEVANCQDCPNRQNYKSIWGPRCVLKTCPKEMPLRADDGACVSCDDYQIISAFNCSVCPNRVELKKPYYNAAGRCVLKECPSEAPIRDTNGICHSCDDRESFKPKDENDCERLCPERQLKNNGYCDRKKVR